MATLADVTEQQQLTNGNLDDLNERFQRFYEQMERDRLDFLEALRESRAGNEPAMIQEVKKEEEKKDNNFLKLLTFLAPFLAAAAGFFTAANGTLAGASSFMNGASATLNGFKTMSGKLSQGINKLLNLTPDTPTTPGAKTPPNAKGTPAPTKTASGRSSGQIFKNAAGNLQKVGLDKNGTLRPMAMSNAEKANLPKSVLNQINQFGDFDPARKVEPGMVSKFLNTDIGKAFENSKVLKTVGRVAKPLGVAFSAAEGYNQRNIAMDKGVDASSARNIGIGAGAANFAGGVLDLFKLPIDAAIGGLQYAGALDEKGAAENFQNFSFGEAASTIVGIEGAGYVLQQQRQVADALVQNTTQSQVDNMSAPVIINNNTSNSTQAPITTVNSSSNSMSSPVNNNGTRPDAYSGA